VCVGGGGVGEEVSRVDEEKTPLFVCTEGVEAKVGKTAGTHRFLGGGGGFHGARTGKGGASLISFWKGRAGG
jgi:hypothetical protein